MTTTIRIEWIQPDEREQEREDSCWYTYSASGHDLVAYVTNGERTVSIYADGEMRIEAYKKVGLEYVHEGTIRYCDQLREFGVLKDSDLWGLPDESYVMPDMVGPNDAGYYYFFAHTSWFDLYNEEGDSLAVCHTTLSHALEVAANNTNDEEELA